jgi:hypothetical protein
VRHNLYDPRYLTPTHQLAPAGALVALYVALERGLRRFRPRVELAVVAVAAAALLVATPGRVPSRQYESMKQIAVELSRIAPGSVLVGGYWETYVFVSLQPRGTMIPVPIQSNRTPWTIEALAAAEEVVVEFGRSEQGGSERPMQRISPYGHELRLARHDLLARDGYAFALYRKHVGGVLSRDGFEGGDTLGWSRSAGSTESNGASDP